jgi:hypothetical protein
LIAMSGERPSALDAGRRAAAAGEQVDDQFAGDADARISDAGEPVRVLRSRRSPRIASRCACARGAFCSRASRLVSVVVATVVLR